MKKGQIVINIILLLGLAGLYILFFTKSSTLGKNQSENIVSKDSNESVYKPDFAVALNEGSNLPIAYINIDTLNEEYLYLQSMRKTLEGQQRSASKRLEKEFKTLQEEYMQFMQSVQNGGYNEQDAMKRDQSFQARSMELEKKREQKLGQLAEKQAKLQKDFRNTLSSYLSKYSEEFNYSYILGSGIGSNVLYASDSLDITREVLNGLNSEYKTSKKK